MAFPTAIRTSGGGPGARDDAAAAAIHPVPGRLGPVPLGGVKDGELYFQRCRWCRTAFFRRLLCPVCASTDTVRERSDGTGFVYRTAVVGQGAAGPHTLALVDMEEGFRLRARILGAPPHTVRIGAPVRLAVDTWPGEQRDMAFRLCGPSAH